MTFKLFRKPETIKGRVKPNVLLHRQFGLLGFALSIYTNEPPKIRIIHINEMASGISPLNPTYIYTCIIELMFFD